MVQVGIAGLGPDGPDLGLDRRAASGDGASSASRTNLQARIGLVRPRIREAKAQDCNQDCKGMTHAEG
jgi:hypothetical protein